MVARAIVIVETRTIVIGVPRPNVNVERVIVVAGAIDGVLEVVREIGGVATSTKRIQSGVVDTLLPGMLVGKMIGVVVMAVIAGTRTGAAGVLVIAGNAVEASGVTRAKRSLPVPGV